jgi:hypothetical protein
MNLLRLLLFVLMCSFMWALLLWFIFWDIWLKMMPEGKPRGLRKLLIWWLDLIP